MTNFDGDARGVMRSLRVLRRTVYSAALGLPAYVLGVGTSVAVWAATSALLHDNTDFGYWFSDFALVILLITAGLYVILIAAVHAAKEVADHV